MTSGLAALDLRHAWRQLRRAPGFTAAAVITFALGIGAGTTVFSLFHAVVQRPLSVSKPDQLFTLIALSPDEPDDRSNSAVSRIFSYPRFERLRAAAGTSGLLAAVSRPMRATARPSGTALTAPVSAQFVSGEFFSTMGVRMQQGRPIAPDDNRHPDADRVAVVSDRYWRDTLGATWSDSHDLVVNGETVTVIGVADRTFSGIWADTPVDIWLPISMQHAIHYQGNAATYLDQDDVPWLNEDRALWLNIIGRLPAGDRSALEARLHQANHVGIVAFADRVFGGSEDPDRQHALRAQLRLEEFSGGFSRLRDRFAGTLNVLTLLFGAIMLVACANIAGLLLVRGAARRREMAIRSAIGATRTHMAGHAIAETLLLAVAGGLIGSAGGYIASLVLARIALGLTDEPLPPAFSLDPAILLFAFSASLLTALLCSIVPSWRAARDEAGHLVDRSSPGSRVLAGTRPLIALQVAIAVVTIIAGGLLARTLTNLMAIDPGFERTSLVSVGIDAAASGVTTDQMNPLYSRLRSALAAVPEVRHVSFSTCALVAGCQNAGGYVIDGYQPGPGERLSIQESRVGAAYVAATGMRLIAGRDIAEGDRANAPPVAIVNEAFARRYFAGRNALGRRIGYGAADTVIVGVVGDARLTALRIAPAPMVFRPLAQTDSAARTILVSVTGDPGPLVALIRGAIARSEPALAITSITPIREQVTRNASRERLAAYVASTFAAITLLLSCVGLYAVLAYRVRSTRRDLGVRLAVGATPARVAGLVLSDGSRMLIGGIVLGLAAAIPAGRVLEPLLFEVTITDTGTFAWSILLLATVALAACYLPARQAARVDPLIALREE